MNLAYRVALACGALPLLVGSSIFLLWLVTGRRWLMMAGIGTLAGGVVVFLVGVVALACFCWIGAREPGVSRRRLRLAAVGAGCLLLSNFVAAGGIVVAAVAIDECYTVVVTNASGRTLDDVRVSGGGCEASFGPVRAGASSRRWLWIRQDGELTFRAVDGPTIRTRIVEGYVTQGMGGRADITVNPDGSIAVSNGRG